ncbi:hypothetical protein CYMTET_8069 [Cymbomonas tetramitiformis]|uniref:Reverse transcriptase domain-containing protein n=1 Tax=Cymbomonas tetramitiformis TaxID=36881 RepID=A0AAE0LGD0_9CHLO|nr:hypothetical protein CYMTET_8069 [Cymbomonas tetramitiformis]
MAEESDSQKAEADDEAAGSVQPETAGVQPTPANSEEDMMKQLLQQQQQITLMMEQLTHLNADKAKGDVAGSPALTKGDKELARHQTLPYCPYREDDPYPTRPATLETRMPQLFDLYGDKTFDSLNKNASSSPKYGQLVLGPALAHFHDAVQFSDDTLELLENQDKVSVSAQEMEQRVYETHSTMMGVFNLMAQRYSMLQLHASLDGDAAAYRGPEAFKAKLAFMEEKVYNNSDGFTNEPIFNQWLQEFENSRQRAVMNTTAKQAARGDGGGGGGVPTFLSGIGQKVEPTLQERVRQRKGAWRAAGANAEVLQCVSRGAKINWNRGPQAPFDHGVSLRDLTATQQTWLEKEVKRHVDNGAWVKAKKREYVSRMFLVPKTGSNLWRIVYDFRWLNAFCWQSRCTMETLTKLRRLAKQDDWCFSFDLKDGYHCMGIDRDIQKYM